MKFTSTMAKNHEKIGLSERDFEAAFILWQISNNASLDASSWRKKNVNRCLDSKGDFLETFAHNDEQFSEFHGKNKLPDLNISIAENLFSDGQNLQRPLKRKIACSDRVSDRMELSKKPVNGDLYSQKSLAKKNAVERGSDIVGIQVELPEFPKMFRSKTQAKFSKNSNGASSSNGCAAGKENGVNTNQRFLPGILINDHQIPLEFPNKLKEMVHGEPDWLFQKKLQKSDVNFHLGRLLLPTEELRLNIVPVLTEEEHELLKDSKQGIRVVAFDSEGQSFIMKFKLWSTADFYVLITGWNQFVRTHALRAKDSVQVWSFRRVETRELCFAIKFRRSND